MDCNQFHKFQATKPQIPNPQIETISKKDQNPEEKKGIESYNHLYCTPNLIPSDMSTLPAASAMAKYLDGSSTMYLNGLIPASLTNPRSCLMQSSRCSSFEISTGVWRSGRDLKYSYTFSWIPLCFPLKKSESSAVFTLSFTRAHVSNWSWWWSRMKELGMGVRCKERRWMRRLTSWLSSSAVGLVLGESIFRTFSMPKRWWAFSADEAWVCSVRSRSSWLIGHERDVDASHLCTWLWIIGQVV